MHKSNNLEDFENNNWYILTEGRVSLRLQNLDCKSKENYSFHEDKKHKSILKNIIK